MDEIAARYGEKLAGLEDDAKDLFQEAEDAKYKLHKFLDRLQNDNTTIPTKEDMNVLEESPSLKNMKDSRRFSIKSKKRFPKPLARRNSLKI